jgi:hypothetical protein
MPSARHARHPSDSPRELVTATVMGLALGALTLTWWWSAMRP